MYKITIPVTAMVNHITTHAFYRYAHRRQRLPCLMIDDLLLARPLTKGRMRKLGLWRCHGVLYLHTTDRFLFVIRQNRIITCYYENPKVSNETSYPTTSAGRKRTGRSSRNTRARRAIRNSSRSLEQRNEFSLQVQSAGVSPESL